MSFSGKPTTFVEQAIENDGFWPNLSVSEFQKGYRLPAEYLVDMLVDDLRPPWPRSTATWPSCKNRWQLVGMSNVEAADPTVLPERTFHAATYKRAVYCRAKASATDSIRHP
jgi:hypothetical protein